MEPPFDPSLPKDPEHSNTVEGVRRRLSNSSNELPFSKILIANRGEIATRIIRSAHELNLRTVSIYSHADRFSLHRHKADESYQIATAEEFTPVAAYLAQERIIKIAKRCGATLIHPGYGFLAENAEFAKKCKENGILFVGPSWEVIEAMGDKTKAKEMALACNVNIVPGSDGAVETFQEAQVFTNKYGYPIILKAAFGGGGRGMRVVRNDKDLPEAFDRARSEALSAFGNGTIFLERFVQKARHIEVQVLADGFGNVVHLWERDCSVQRRHQKVVEIAPALNLNPKTRRELLEASVRMAKWVGYKNAGTFEFLVEPAWDGKGEDRWYFMEVNPRIQVEHTITEEITGVDLVAAQIEIARGKSLAELDFLQEKIVARGFAIQARITTEDPENGFAPDSGKIEVYRSSGGPGVRLDAGSGFTGSVITPHYDSLLVKVSCRGATYDICCRRMIRCLVEYRIRGVKTNIGFLLRLLTHETFLKGQCWTTFVDDTPDILKTIKGMNRAQKILNFMANIVVNGSKIPGKIGEVGYHDEVQVPLLPPLENGVVRDVQRPSTTGWREIFLKSGPAAFAAAIRKHPQCLIMDTTWRDAHQSLLATRLRTIDMAKIAKTTSHALQSAFALEMWGGATFDVCLRFLHECPWDRLIKLRKLVPNIPFQMLLRGANAVGYTAYPDNVVKEFCKKARELGIDVFRIFDSLNYVENLKFGIEAVREAGGIIEAAICYTGDITNAQLKKYTLDYYLDLVGKLVSYGIHILAIKDMAGLLKPLAARKLVGAIRKAYPDLPIHVHTHDTAGTGVASMLACIEAGADIIDVAIDSMSGMTSQPSMGAVVAAFQGSEYDTGIRFGDVQALNQYWEQVRLLYACFDADVKSGDSGVYEHEMPGGQYTNLLFQARSLGLGQQWAAVKKAYKEANLLCGDIVKVTPSSKVVGDLAQFMVSTKNDYNSVQEKASSLSLPTSVVEFFQGYLGQPYGGFPEPLRSNIIKKLPKIEGRPGASLPPLDLEALRRTLVKKYGPAIRDVDALSAALYPKVFNDYYSVYEQYNDLSVVPTLYFLSKMEEGKEVAILLEKGKRIIVKLLACGPLNLHTAKRDVFFELNGEPRVIQIGDMSAAIQHVERERVQPNAGPGEVGAPLSGVVVEIRVKEGAHVNDGDPLCILSAMKMETVVSAPVTGKIGRIAISVNDSLTAGDLICLIVKE